jgi:ubiquinone/menaquinone biosynthesis C-methylase UbiE
LRVADAIHGTFVHTQRVERLAVLICDMLPPDATVADIGAGDGLVTSLLMAARPDIRVRAFDVSDRKSLGANVELFDGKRIPLPDESVDVVLLVDVLHHADDACALLFECARVAKQAVIVKDHLCDSFGAQSTLAFMDWIGNARHGVHMTYRYFGQLEWNEVIASAGLITTHWRVRLGLYPRALDAIFGRKLHFIGRFARQ